MDILKTTVGHHISNLFTEHVASIIASFLVKDEEEERAKEQYKLMVASLYGASLCNADLSEADLTSANLQGSDLTRVNFYKANLSKSKMADASTEGMLTQEANLSGIIWS